MCQLKLVTSDGNKSDKKWWSKNVGAKLLAHSVIFSKYSSDIPLDFRVVLLKYLINFLAITHTKKISNIPEEKYFAPLRILNLFIKSFVNCFVDIALTFFSSFNSFLFQSAFFTKLVISFLLTKFTCANLAVKFSALNFLNSWVVICY